MRRTIALLAALAGLAFAGQADAATLKFSESFSTPVSVGSFASAYGQKFDNYDGSCDSPCHGTYDNARTLSVHDGVLDIDLHSESGVRYVAALLPKWPCPSGTPGRWVDSYGNGVCHSITYGAATITFSVVGSGAHYKTAWLMWPDSNVWPGDGELNFMESCSDLTGNMCAFTHPATTPNTSASFDSGIKYTDTYYGHPTWGSYHKIDFEWDTDSACYQYDDGPWECHASEPGYPVPSGPMHLVLQNETEPVSSYPSTSARWHIYVDQMDVWQK